MLRSHSATGRWARRPTMVGVSRVALILSALVWAGTLTAETLPSGAALRASLPGTGRGRTTESDRLLDATTDADETEPVLASELLPKSASGWVVQGPQEVPGSEGSAAEEYFNPAEEELKLVTPLVVYVQVRRESDDATAARILSEFVSGRYQTPGTALVEGRKVITAVTSDDRSYFVGWTSGPHVYRVDASFTHFVPGGARTILTRAATAVAGEIIGMPGARGEE